MSFEEQYNKIKLLVSKELDLINNEMANFDCGNKTLQKRFNSLLNAPAKRLRPLLTLLFLKANNIQISDTHIKILSAIELIHTATLIHDDVIDNSESRREQKTLNASFDNNLAVIAGDFLLSIVLKKILEINSFEIFSLFHDAIEKMCKGEINQYFSKRTIPKLSDYIEKSKNKTAMLFITALKSIATIEPSINNSLAESFAENFGIGFQIRDDLLNFTDKNQSDYDNGIFTAPIIFAKNINNLSYGIEKTKELLDNYLDKAISKLEILNDNEWKSTLIALVRLFKI